MMNSEKTISFPTKLMIPLMDRMISTSITLPLEILEAAVIVANINNIGVSTLSPLFCAQNDQIITAIGGVSFTPNRLLRHQDHADWIIVPALWGNPLKIVRQHQVYVLWLKEQYELGAVLIAVGTGVTLLAEANLLNSRPATTHWYYMQKLQAAYPLVIFKPHHLITCTDRIYCAGSVNSIADLMIYLVGLIFGQTLATKIAQQFSHEIRCSFDRISYTGEYAPHHDEAIILLQDWIHSHYENTITLCDMAKKSQLQVRTLHRRFMKATGVSPMQYLKNIRMRKASELLRKSNLNIHEIALQSGYDNTNYFSHVFKCFYQLRPSHYRQSVRSKLFHHDDNI